MSMRIGVGVFSANKDVAVTRDASALAVDIFMKRRRSIISATFLSFRAKSRNLLLLSIQNSRCLDSARHDRWRGEPNDSTRSWKRDRRPSGRSGFSDQRESERRIIRDADTHNSFLSRETTGDRPRNMEGVR